jgi:membrane protein required for colicin V production
LIDLAVGMTLLLSGIFAWYRGLIRELLGITSWVAAVLAAIYGAPFLAPVFGNFIESDSLANIIAAAVSALVTLVVFTLVNSKINTLLRKSALSSLDRLLGFFFGLIRGGFLICLFYFCLSLVFAPSQIESLQPSSVTLSSVKKATKALENLAPEKTLAGLKSSTKETFQKQSVKNKENPSKNKQKPADGLEEKNLPEYDNEERKALDDLISKELEL